MSLVPQFLASLDRTRDPGPAGPWPLLARTVVALADTLPGVDGAAICLSRPLGVRVPVAVSDGPTLLAEQLEFTTGSGPALLARRLAQPVLAGANLGRRYPAFHDGLVSSTALRAMMAIPLGVTDDIDPPAVLLLFHGTTAPVDQAAPAALAEILELSRLISQAVTSTAGDLVRPPPGRPSEVPVHVHRRLAVESAVRMIVAADRIPADDALAVLRAHAWARGRLVDDAAHDLVTDVLTVTAFR